MTSTDDSTSGSTRADTPSAARSRATRQGHAVQAALAAADGFRSAQDLHAEIRRGGAEVGLTTVYRHLQALADGGAVDVVRSPDGEALYRRCESAEHHHHVVCRSCGRSVEVSGPEVEAWAERVAGAAGFRDVVHTVEVIGTCGPCAEGAA